MRNGDADNPTATPTVNSAGPGSMGWWYTAPSWSDGGPDNSVPLAILTAVSDACRLEDRDEKWALIQQLTVLMDKFQNPIVMGGFDAQP
jgi:hypothetical protein